MGSVSTDSCSRVASRVSNSLPVTRTTRDALPASRQAKTGAKTIGSISIDLDCLSDYSSGYGFEYTRKPDPVYTLGLTRFLDLLSEVGVSATLFTIARDAAIPEHAEVLQRAVALGHEIANHTMTHPRGLASLPEAEMRREILEAHDVLSALRGAPLTGFRAPCYDVNDRVLDVLREAGYAYDSSIHPTIMGPVIDLTVFVKSGFRNAEFRPATYASLLAPAKPYRPGACYWRSGGGDALLELPVAGLPWCRLPFYGTFTQITGMSAFRASLAWFKLHRRPLNFHYHAVELVDLDDEGVDPRLAVHPGLKKPVEQKREEVAEMLKRFRDGFELVTLEEKAGHFSEI